VFPYHGSLLDYSRDTLSKDRSKVTMNNFTKRNACLLDAALNITSRLAKETGGTFGVTAGHSFSSLVCFKEMCPRVTDTS
jgi:hypothetical protein